MQRALRANDRLLDLCQQDVPMLPLSDPLPQGVLLSLGPALPAPGVVGSGGGGGVNRMGLAMHGGCWQGCFEVEAEDCCWCMPICPPRVAPLLHC